VLETEAPTAIRRQIAVSEAVYRGRATVEGMTAVRVEAVHEVEDVLARGEIPLAVDPEGAWISRFSPLAVVDAILAKRNLGTHRGMAPLTVALGPGFTAGKDVDYVVETMRGHSLGRIIVAGQALPNTGVPGVIAGVAAQRVIHADSAGVLLSKKAIGDTVRKGETIAVIRNDSGEHPVPATIDGLLRGMIRDGFAVKEGLKIADIDPRIEAYDNCFTISDKARCIAGSVLELVCRRTRGREKG